MDYGPVYRIADEWNVKPWVDIKVQKIPCVKEKGWEDMFVYEWGGMKEHCRIKGENDVMLRRGGTKATKRLKGGGRRLKGGGGGGGRSRSARAIQKVCEHPPGLLVDIP